MIIIVQKQVNLEHSIHEMPQTILETSSQDPIAILSMNFTIRPNQLSLIIMSRTLPDIFEYEISYII